MKRGIILISLLLVLTILAGCASGWGELNKKPSDHMDIPIASENKAEESNASMNEPLSNEDEDTKPMFSDDNPNNTESVPGLARTIDGIIVRFPEGVEITEETQGTITLIDFLYEESRYRFCAKETEKLENLSGIPFDGPEGGPLGPTQPYSVFDQRNHSGFHAWYDYGHSFSLSVFSDGESEQLDAVCALIQEGMGSAPPPVPTPLEGIDVIVCLSHSVIHPDSRSISVCIQNNTEELLYISGAHSIARIENGGQRYLEMDGIPEWAVLEIPAGEVTTIPYSLLEYTETICEGTYKLHIDSIETEAGERFPVPALEFHVHPNAPVVDGKPMMTDN